MGAAREPARAQREGRVTRAPSLPPAGAFEIGSQLLRALVFALLLLASHGARAADAPATTTPGLTDKVDCDEVRATELARESARARGFAVERMHVAKLVGPTVWARFVEVEPRYATDHDAQRDAVGSRSFFYVALRYPPRPSQLPEPGKAGVAIIPIGGSGHGVWVDSFTCELLEYLSGI